MVTGVTDTWDITVTVMLNDIASVGVQWHGILGPAIKSGGEGVHEWGVRSDGKISQDGAILGSSYE